MEVNDRQSESDQDIYCDVFHGRKSRNKYDKTLNHFYAALPHSYLLTGKHG